jgi:16S rRNA (cytidine1402-2'-O)-methyltransferase
VALCRELTKAHEEVRRGTASVLLDQIRAGVRGEVVLVVEAAPAADRASAAVDRAALRQAADLLRAEGLAPRAAARLAARLLGGRANDAYPS